MRLVVLCIRWIGAVMVLLILTAWILSWPFLVMASHHGLGAAILFSLQAIVAIAALGLLPFKSDRRWAWFVAAGVAGWLPLLAIILYVLDRLTDGV